MHSDLVNSVIGDSNPDFRSELELLSKHFFQCLKIYFVMVDPWLLIQTSLNPGEVWSKP